MPGPFDFDALAKEVAGAFCRAGFQCCTGMCGPNGCFCGSRGTSCLDSFECCSGSCINGRCS